MACPAAGPGGRQDAVHGRASFADERPFFLLDPADLADPPRKASSIKGASRSARTVDISDLAPVDLVVAGSVAVSPDGSRIGKGGGFSDLEFAIATEAGLISDRTFVVTTVHEVQVVDDGAIPTTDHDVPVDLIVTPERVIACRRRRRRRLRIDWADLTDEKVGAIPLLGRLRAQSG